MDSYEIAREELQSRPRSWLLTGAAGFIGSNILKELLKLDQHVLGVDNFMTGKEANLAEVRRAVSPAQWSRFSLERGDIRDAGLLRAACSGMDHLVHQAALGSVPWSVDDPVAAHEHNMTGFLNVLLAARKAKVRSLVHACSSAVYGDAPEQPARESGGCRLLSPYAATKLGNEVYAQVFGLCYGLKTVGLRYFNIFGPRQDPAGAYAAVIPLWFSQLIHRQPVFINGDGETTRDFCYVEDCVQANILAATCARDEVRGQVFNIGCGQSTSLNALYRHIRALVAERMPEAAGMEPRYRDFRIGDVRFSEADTRKARDMLGFRPRNTVREGLAKAAGWYMEHLAAPAEPRTGIARKPRRQPAPASEAFAPSPGA